jgi:hypothetical protein
MVSEQDEGWVVVRIWSCRFRKLRPDRPTETCFFRRHVPHGTLLVARRPYNPSLASSWLERRNGAQIMVATHEQITRCILSGIIDGNDTLEQWSGEWLCDRWSSEYQLHSSCGNSLLRLRETEPTLRIWPEVEAKSDFEFIKTFYRTLPVDRNLTRVFGGVRYDLGILEDTNRLSHLIELKRYWDQDETDLTKLARALYYLKADTARGATGVHLTSVFFGAFLYHRPQHEYPGLPRDEQESKIRSNLELWWQKVTVHPDSPKLIGNCQIRKSAPEFRWVPKRDWWSGAVCVCLSIGRP